MDPAESYNLLLAFQSPLQPPLSTGSSMQHGSTSDSHDSSPYTSSEAMHIKQQNPEWHEMVDVSVLESLSRAEGRRQGLWWELIKGETEYVRDLRIVAEVCGHDSVYAQG